MESSVGDPNVEVTGVASLSEAVAGEVTFYADPRYLERLRKTRASAIFVPLTFSEQTAAAQIRVANPSKAFEQVVLKLAPKPIEYSHLESIQRQLSIRVRNLEMEFRSKRTP